MKVWLFLAAGAVLGACSPSASAGEQQLAVLQALDKVTARVSRLEALLDRTIRFGTLDITVRACHRAPPEEPPESAAFLEIDERHASRPAERLYTGWMFASSPSLAALEHPVYDIWVLACVGGPPTADNSPSEKPAG